MTPTTGIAGKASRNFLPASGSGTASGRGYGRECVCVDQEFLIPVPEELPLKLAALTEPLSVAEHCIENRSAIGEGSSVVVSGPGIIGLLSPFRPAVEESVLLSGTERDEPTRLRAAREIGFETLVVGPGLVALDEQVLHFFPEEPMPS